MESRAPHQISARCGARLWASTYSRNSGHGGSNYLDQLKITTLLRPHRMALLAGLLAVIGEGAADLLQPWPLKIVFDNVLGTRPAHGHGWMNHRIVTLFGTDHLAILRLAVVAALVIAIADSLCTYAEKYVTTSVGQWVTHELRRTLYSH